MGKICILSTVNLKHMTLISLYTDYMDKHKIPYDIIYIDKYHSDENINAENIYKYDLYIKRDWSLPRKFIRYWKFKGFAKKILLANKYDFIITWNVFTAFMFADILEKHYGGRYCLNIRDVSTRYRSVIEWNLKKALNSSAFATISSDGFRKALPPFDYTMIHSMNMKILNSCVPHKELKTKGEPIKITYVGYMCYYENCYRLIDELGNDERFLLQFYGEGSDLVENYASEKGFTNVECRGRFEPEETSTLIQQSDIIYNLYDVGNINVDTALSIKLYYAIYLNIPILVFKNTYMQEVSEQYGIGYAIDKEEFVGLGDRLYEWYYSLDQKEINKKCQVFIEEIKRSHENLKDLMVKHLN